MAGKKHKEQNTERKTILFTEYFSFFAGGQIVLIKMLKSLRKKYDIRVLIFNRGMIENELKKLKINYDYIQSPRTVKYRYFWNMLPFFVKLHRYLSENKIDLIYNNGYFTTKLTAVVAKMKGMPVIWHKHQIIDKKYNAYLAVQIRRFAKMVTKMICVSDATLESLASIGVDRDKLITIRNGMEIPGRIDGSIRQKLIKLGKFSNRDFIVGTVGYFRRNKAFEILIQAAEIIRKKEKNIKFLIIGKAEDDVAYEAELRAMVKEKNLSDVVVMPGVLNKQKCMPGFDIFALPSYNEPFALVILESMSMGVPVLGFKMGGTKEIVKDNINGFLVKDFDHKKYAERILKLYKNKKLIRTAGKKAKETIVKEYTIKKQMDEIDEVIKSCV